MENTLLNCLSLHHSQDLSIHKPMGLLAQDSIMGGATTHLRGKEGELLPMNSRPKDMLPARSFFVDFWC